MYVYAARIPRALSRPAYRINSALYIVEVGWTNECISSVQLVSWEGPYVSREFLVVSGSGSEEHSFG